MERLQWFLYRLRGLFQRGRHERAVDEEMRFHLEEEADRLAELGMSPADAANAARRSLGSPSAIREYSRDVWTWPRLEQLARDIRYGARQLVRSKSRSAAAILSLGLALGACTATFLVMDALLFRPLPVDGAERLYVMFRHTIDRLGRPSSYDSCEYPLFERMRASVKGDADLLAVSFAAPTDLTYRSDQELERAQVQYVSGDLFTVFKLAPALGRVFTADDDRVPGGHPQAVITHAYWTRRFDRDPAVLGRALRIDTQSYEIVGVAAEGFTGTEPGTSVDVMLPAAMHNAVAAKDNSWLRALIRLAPGVDPRRIRDILQADVTSFHRERAATFVNLPPDLVQRFLAHRVELEHSPAGASGLQLRYRSGLMALAGLVALVLLVACVNVANLMIARTAARGREMALRTSLGAGRSSLVQLVLAECAWLAGLSALVGLAFGMLAAPYIVGQVNPPDSPAQLLLRLDWRAVTFVGVLTLVVTGICGIASSYAAVRVPPSSALRGGHTPRSYRRVMQGLVLVQVAFCFLVVFISGLLVTTLSRLTQQQLGFSPDRVLAVRIVASQLEPPVVFEQLADHVRGLAGVEAASIGDQTLLDGGNWNNVISIGGVLRPEPTFLRSVTPGWLDTMRIALLAGREVAAADQHPSTAVVNEAFARLYFGGENPLDRTFAISGAEVRIIGLVADARYTNLREPVPPIAYVPFRLSDETGGIRPKRQATLIVRTAPGAPADLPGHLRSEITRVQPGVYVSGIKSQTAIVESHTLRERLLATLSAFFAAVALLMAAVGLYGVIDYAALQRRREIGICLALGAPAARVVRTEFTGVFVMVAAGAAVGVLISLRFGQVLDTLLFGVAGTDSVAVAGPLAVVCAIAALACVPPILRAVRTDLTATIRAQ